MQAIKIDDFCWKHCFEVSLSLVSYSKIFYFPERQHKKKMNAELEAVDFQHSQVSCICSLIQ